MPALRTEVSKTPRSSPPAFVPRQWSAVVLAGLLVCDFLGMSAGGFAPLHHQQRPKAAFLSVTSSGRSISRTRASTPHPILSFLPGKEAGLSFRSSILLLRAESSSGSSSASSAKNASEVSHGEIRDYRNAMSISRTNGNGGGSADKTLDVTMKFGGSSLANYERIDHVAHLIKTQLEAGYRPRAVVCSAMGKTTNSLLSAGEFALEGRVCIDAIRTLHKATMDHFDFPEHTVKEVTELLDECEDMLNGVRLIQELSPKSLDQLVSYGERCSVRIMAARLNQIGVPAQSFDAWDVGVLTTSDFGDAKLLPESEKAIKAAFSRIDPNVVAVVTGFIGHDANKRITTLGRGGSDLTATALGAALDVDEIQVWKDVDGILTSDPRVVKTAIPVTEVTYEEASELAYFGAQVLHPIAMQPAMKKDVPVRVKNSYNPEAVGTIISHRKTETDPLVTAITYKRDIKMMDIQSTQMLGAYGFLAKVFGVFENRKLSVDVLASSEVSISLTLDKKQSMEDIQLLMNDLEQCAEITLEEGKSILTLITDVERSSEVLATVFRVFASQDISVEMMSQGASKVNISFILKDSDLDRAMLELHRCFFEDECSVPIMTKQASLQANETLLFKA